MSGKLESALVIELSNSIKWGAALAPTAADGSLTQVQPDQTIDITKYSRRDRELVYRDLVDASAVVRVSLHAETVWNAAAPRPKLQGIANYVLPPTLGDLRAVDSTVVHVLNSSLPSDALATDKDLSGRDALIYKVLSDACSVFTDAPIAPGNTGIPGTVAWSLGEGLEYGVQPSPALPLNKDAFYLSDVSLAERDNQIAAYAALLAQILNNPFEFASRLYVRVDGVDARDAEIYSLIRNYYAAGTAYNVGDEVFYQTGWYRAVAHTLEIPGAGAEWVSIPSPSVRVWVAEPALDFRNRILYDTEAKTLQWFMELTDTLHPPQLFAMSIPGIFSGQVITTLAQVPERKDCQYWRQKSARVDTAGVSAELKYHYADTTVIGSGVKMADTVGLTSQSDFSFPLNTPVLVGRKYRISALVKPTQVVEINGVSNNNSLTGSGQGAAFSGAYAPTGSAPGQPVAYGAFLPAGTWYLKVDYTNKSGVTSGFGVRINHGSTIVSGDTSSWLFQDVNGNPLVNGDNVESPEYQFSASGSSLNLEFVWTYGTGELQINKITLRTADHASAEYYIKAEIHDALGNDIYFGDAPTIESTGRKNVFEVLNWDFYAIETALAPTVTITWFTSPILPPELPLQFRQISVAELVDVSATESVRGFESFKWECTRRAEKSVVSAFNEQIASSGTVSDFTVDGTLWDGRSTEAWMSFIEVREPRLRQVSAVTSIANGRQYLVADGGYVVYNNGTYSNGEVFNGTTSSSFLSYGTAVVDQVGAFRLSAPVDMGHPSLMPLGLRYDEPTGSIVTDSEPVNLVPVVVATQPWMVEAGLYAADEDFRASDTVANTANSVTITVTIDPAGGGTTTGAGRYIIFDSITLVATPTATWTFVGWYDTNNLLLSASGTYTFDALENLDVTARFTL